MVNELNKPIHCHKYKKKESKNNSPDRVNWERWRIFVQCSNCNKSNFVKPPEEDFKVKYDVKEILFDDEDKNY